MRYLTICTVLAATAAIGACNGGQGAAVNEDALRRELAQRWADWTDAVQSGDVERIAAFWSDDARILEPGVNLDGGEILPFIRDFLTTASVLSFEHQTYDVFVHGDVAYETGQYDETIQMEGQEPATVQNYYFMRWERGSGGVWRFDRLVAGPREPEER